MTAVNLNRAVRGPVTAVPVVAGKGVRIVPDTVNNRFVVEADETVLWDGGSSPMTYGGSATVSESLTNFDRIRVYYCGEDHSTRNHRAVAEIQVTGSDNIIGVGGVISGYTDGKYNFALLRLSYNDNTLSVGLLACARYNMNAATPIDWATNTTNFACIYKIVGINRISST